MARGFYQQYLPQLEKIGEKYGVQPRFIVALWGWRAVLAALWALILFHRR